MRLTHKCLAALFGIWTLGLSAVFAGSLFDEADHFLDDLNQMDLGVEMKIPTLKVSDFGTRSVRFIGGQFIGQIIKRQGDGRMLGQDGVFKACGFEFAGFVGNTNKTELNVKELGLGTNIELMPLQLLTEEAVKQKSGPSQYVNYFGGLEKSRVRMPRVIVLSTDKDSRPVQFFSQIGSESYVCKIEAYLYTDGLSYTRENGDIVAEFNRAQSQR
jgi:hypothetical protein